MTGVIWLIQLVHYPSFSRIDAAKFAEFHQFHTKNISFIVLPLMLTELITAFYLIYQKSPFQYSLQFGLSLVLIIWLSTFLLQVPAHNALAHGFDDLQYKKLINTNWIRTIAWTLRSFVLIFILFKLLID